MEILLFAIGVGIIGYVAFIFLFPKVVPEDSSKRTKSALNQLYETSQLSLDQQKDGGILRDEFAEEAPHIKMFYGLPKMNNIYVAAVQAGYQKNLPVIAVLLIACLFISVGLFFKFGFGPMSLLFGPLFTYFIPLKYFRRKVRKRNEKFIFLFPDVLDMIVRSVRSGFPITTALKMVAENMEAPVSTEFQQVVNEIAVGRPLSESLSRLANRINEQDINFFVVVLNVQQETGGNLAEVISNLSGIIRKRKQLRLKIKAMTSEGRATAMILGALPFGVFFVLYIIQRDYLAPLWEDPKGKYILGAGLGLVAGCMLIVNNMIDIDI